MLEYIDNNYNVFLNQEGIDWRVYQSLSIKMNNPVLDLVLFNLKDELDICILNHQSIIDACIINYWWNICNNSNINVSTNITDIKIEYLFLK
jgi:hypothetical protein